MPVRGANQKIAPAPNLLNNTGGFGTKWGNAPGNDEITLSVMHICCDGDLKVEFKPAKIRSRFFFNLQMSSRSKVCSHRSYVQLWASYGALCTPLLTQTIK